MDPRKTWLGYDPCDAPRAPAPAVVEIWLAPTWVEFTKFDAAGRLVSAEAAHSFDAQGEQ